MDCSCATKYPIMLIHGIGYNDENYNRYWGRIPGFLRERGAELYFGNQDPFGSIRQNAARLKISADQALRESGAEKLNLIAHSKGGIEARYLISGLNMAHKIASLTTLATPHRGILSMDRMRERSKLLYYGMLRLFDTMLMIDGRQKNPSIAVYSQMTRDYMQVFNQVVPDAEEVYYQSYAFDMKNAISYPAMGIFYRFIKKAEGPNDGLVAVCSAKWGQFQGIYTGPGRHGISHPEAADSGRKIKAKKKNGAGLLDITHLYWDIVSRLKSLGY